MFALEHKGDRRERLCITTSDRKHHLLFLYILIIKIVGREPVVCCLNDLAHTCAEKSSQMALTTKHLLEVFLMPKKCHIKKVTLIVLTPQ